MAVEINQQLSNILNNYFTNNGGIDSATDIKLRLIITSSDALANVMNQAAADKLLTGMIANSDPKVGASMGDKILSISLDYISTHSTEDVIWVLAHEIDHAQTAPIFDAAFQKYASDVIARAKTAVAGTATTDFTDLVLGYDIQNMKNESRADAAGWNALVDYIQQTNIKNGAAPTSTVSWNEIYLADPGRAGRYLQMDASTGEYVPRPEIRAVLNPATNKMMTDDTSLAAIGSLYYYPGDLYQPGIVTDFLRLAYNPRSGLTLGDNKVSLDLSKFGLASDGQISAFMESLASRVKNEGQIGNGTYTFYDPSQDATVSCSKTFTTAATGDTSASCTAQIYKEIMDGNGGIAQTKLSSYTATENGLQTIYKNVVSQDDHGDGRVDRITTSIYTQGVSDFQRTLTSEAVEGYAYLSGSGALNTVTREAWNYADNTLTRDVTNMNPGGSQCTATHQVFRLDAPSVQLSEVDSLQSSNGTILSATVSGTGAIVQADNADIVLADNASATINGNGNTVQVGKNSTAVYNGIGNVQTAGTHIAVSGTTTVTGSADGQKTIIAQDTDQNGIIDKSSTVTQVSQAAAETAIDTNADGKPDTYTLTTATGTTYNLLDFNSRSDAEYYLGGLYSLGRLSPIYWNAYTSQSANMCLANDVYVPTVNAFSPNTAWLEPIGAFYDSQSTTYDNAASIAAYTPVLLDAANHALTAAQLTALDANADGQLSGTETSPLKFWRDLNENGFLDNGELAALDSNIKQTDYAFYTQGNGLIGSAVPAEIGATQSVSLTATSLTLPTPPIVPAPNLAPNVPDSNYRTLRDTDNVYHTANGGSITWTSSQIKINESNKSYLIGTDGADDFDFNYFSSNPLDFDSSLLTNFLAGDGDDDIGGSNRNDNLWGGIGNDRLSGYAGDDNLYGEQGADRLWGQAGNDTLDGGEGDDVLFGGIGSDLLYGGQGADELLGYDGNDVLDGGADNDLLWGELGDDTLFGGLGADRLNGEEGNDTLDGGEGDDVLFGGIGSDLLYGGQGADELQGYDGNDVLDGGADNDLLWGERGDDTLFGGLGADRLHGEEGNDTLDGGEGDDRLFGEVGSDTLWGGDGNDTLVGFTASNATKQTLDAGESDDDILFGGAGNDLMFGDFGDDRLFGGTGNDELQGGVGQDELSGGEGDDRLFGQVGNDTLWGGDGNDVLVGFTAGNDPKQTLDAGESDDDILSGGAGNDLMFGDFGDDQLIGGTGNDELQGGSGNDMLYGEDGNDKLFGQAGDDVMYGGNGDDYLQGFTGSNAAQQTLSVGETDNDKLYGGAGRDTLVGNLGDDYLDGGEGADVMIGGEGNDVYVVNSVNDSVYEQAGNGYDQVLSSTSYLLNANVEELRLLEGFAIHGTGNAQDNKIIGNSSDNILDGVTGADTMIGGTGNDTYYVDNVGDQVVENANEGTDMVQSSIGYTLGENLENLVLLDFSKPEKGLVDGQEVLVYGYPKRNELDYMQGDAVPNYLGTCALTSIANLITQAGRPTSESEVVTLAIDNNWAVNNPDLPPYKLGGSNVVGQQAILDSYHIRNSAIAGYNETGIANLVRSGRGVIIGVNAGKLWGEADYVDDGGTNHAITLTGAVYKADDGSLAGFYVTDSGRGLVSDMTRFVDIAAFREAANVPNAHAIYTIEPVKFWNENIDGTGNNLDNSLIGNRGDNVLLGMAGNDVLEGGAGNDTLEGGAGSDTLNGGTGDDIYRFGLGDGHDVINGADGVDTLKFGTGINAGDVVVSNEGSDIVLSLNALDSIRFSNSNGIVVDRVTFADGITWYAKADGSGFNGSLTGDLAIVGDATQGQTLTLLNTLQDTDGLGAFHYQWQASSDGTGWSDIAGATGDSLVLGQEQVGQQLRMRLDYTDGRGNAEGVITRASVAVANVNDAPVVANAIADQAATEDAVFSFVVPTNTFADVDAGDVLTLSATLANGDPLPSWLTFDATTRTFSGTPTNGDVGSLSIKLTVTDTAGANASQTFSVAVANVNDTPAASGLIADQAATQGTAFSFAVPANAFTDIDIGDVLSYSATLANGDPLPNWLSFDAVTQTFSGTPANGDIGNLSITVIATDKAGIFANQNWTLVVSSADQTLVGTAGNDVLIGGAGNDTLDGSAGADTLIGGSGNDLYVVDSAGDVVVENINGGIDTVQTTTDNSGRWGIAFALSDNVENLVLSGWTWDDGIGNALDNVLTGNFGNNVLDGGQGADTLIGGEGNDTFICDNLGDVVTENANEGIDTVQSSVSLTLGANVENLTLTGTGNLTATGNELDNVIEGNDGASTLTGGQGNDTYVIYNANTTIVENANEGIDTVETHVDYVLGANIENATVVGWGWKDLTGNALDNVLTGNTGNNVLDGGQGADILIGGDGNDTFIVDNLGDVVTENANEGIDTVQSSVSFTLGANVENLTLTGTENLTATGNALDNVIEGNDGASTLVGGAGNDTYVIYNANTTIVENANEGIDTVETHVDYVLGANIENATVVGWGWNDLTGNALDNVLTGNTGNNVLDGGQGADTLIGGDGNDTFIVDNLGDVVMENANEGIDTVLSSVSFTLSANVENLTLTGTGDLTATGNALDNVIEGNDGASTLAGGQGNDTYVIYNANTTIVENATEGIDTVETHVDYALGANIENATVVGWGWNDLTGNALDNVLTGNTGNNILDAGAGDDTLIGGEGSDKYQFGLGYGHDTVIENDATVGNYDKIRFGAGVTEDQLWFSHVGNDLQVSIIGTTDYITVKDWYSGSAQHVEEFLLADWRNLSDTNVENLVQAMASFTPPAVGQTTLPQTYQDNLAPVIAANWQW